MEGWIRVHVTEEEQNPPTPQTESAPVPSQGTFKCMQCMVNIHGLHLYQTVSPSRTTENIPLQVLTTQDGSGPLA